MSQESNIDDYRRKFLGKVSAVGAGLSLLPGVFLHEIATARPENKAVSNEVRFGLLIDANKCGDNCNRCVSACGKENGLDEKASETNAQWIRKLKLKHNDTGRTLALPMLCQHCEFPPCVDVCPTGASFKRADGIVLVDKHLCIGCRYCMMACPYKARSFVHEELTGQVQGIPRGKGTVESCTLCVHRVDRGDSPACVEACNSDGNGAMVFGDLRDPSSDIAKRVAQFSSTQVRADLGLNPGVRYQGI